MSDRVADTGGEAEPLNHSSTRLGFESDGSVVAIVKIYSTAWWFGT